MAGWGAVFPGRALVVRATFMDHGAVLVRPPLGVFFTVDFQINHRLGAERSGVAAQLAVDPRDIKSRGANGDRTELLERLEWSAAAVDFNVLEADRGVGSRGLERHDRGLHASRNQRR